jgi:hypothetical protein
MNNNPWRLRKMRACVHHDRVRVLLHVPDYSEPLTDDAIGDFNRVFAPYARVLVLHIPRPLTYDGEHFTSEGAAKVARALWNGRPDDHPR